MHHSTFANLSLDAVGRWRVHRTPGQVQWWCGTNGRAEGGRATIVSPHRASPCPVSPGYPWPPPGAVSTSCTSSVAEPGPEDEDTHAAPARPRHRRQPRPGRGRDRGHHQGEAPRREGGRRHGPVLLRLQGGPLRQAASQGT